MPSWNHGRVLRSLAIRFGLAAIGAVYLALGIVSARVAFLGARDRGQGVPGALRFLLGQTHGARILEAVVAGLAVIALVRFGEAIWGRYGAATRVGLALNGAGYAALAWSAARVLFRISRDGGSPERAGVGWLIGQPWGAAVLEVVGAGVVSGGVFEAWQGLRGHPAFSRRLLPRRLGRLLVGIARFGQVARGVVLAGLGYFVIRAAVELDPGRVRGVGGVMRIFSRTALGPVFMGVVALGLAAYGVYMAALALLQRRV